MTVKFTVLGKPQPKQRARTVSGHSYTPEKTVLYENLVKLCYPGGKFDGPVAATITLYWEIPKSYSKKRTKACEMNIERPMGKNLGDCDNLAKSILDSLNGIAYNDDAQVVSLTVTKLWGEPARAEIILKEE